MTDKKPHQPLGADDKGQREEDQQVGGEHREAEMADNAYVGINATSKRGRPVGDKQVTAANDERKQNIEQCKPVPPN